MQFYLEALNADGKLAIMGPTYYNLPPGQNRSKQLVKALSPSPRHNWPQCGPYVCAGNPNINAMFGIAFTKSARPHRNYGWTATDFAPMVQWLQDEGVCEIGIYTSPQGNSFANNSWTKFVAPWMVRTVQGFLENNCSCTNCPCTNCTRRLPTGRSQVLL